MLTHLRPELQFITNVMHLSNVSTALFSFPLDVRFKKMSEGKKKTTKQCFNAIKKIVRKREKTVTWKLFLRVKA